METISIRASGHDHKDKKILLVMKGQDPRLSVGKTAEEIAQEDAKWLLEFILSLPYITVKELMLAMRNHPGLMDL